MPWGKYYYRTLPMGLCEETDTSQESMSFYFKKMETILVYVADIIVIVAGDFK